MTRVAEADFQRTVLHYAKLHGWRAGHFTRGRTPSGGWATPTVGDARGFPDLVLTRRDRLVFAELKAEHGRVSIAQRDWLEDLKRTPAEVYLWRPSQWDEIQEALK